ncbi:intraflagellar transport-associated protein [Ctenodactylus gundi]
MDEDRVIKEVLDKFVNCHEQTYTEFLNTFTYLSKENNVTKRGAFGTSASKNTFTSAKIAHIKEPDDCHLRNRTTFLRASSQCSEEGQIVMDEGQRAGSSFQGDLKRAGKVKVDNFLDLEDLDMDEEFKPHIYKGSMLLPGAIEEDVSTSGAPYVPSVERPHLMDVKPPPTAEGQDKQTEEILGDEVQTFSLDEEFDYDNVTLTPKFTPAELEAIKEPLKQESKNTRTNVCDPQN